jgi:hypothetical protein
MKRRSFFGLFAAVAVPTVAVPTVVDAKPVDIASNAKLNNAVSELRAVVRAVVREDKWGNRVLALRDSDRALFKTLQELHNAST